MSELEEDLQAERQNARDWEEMYHVERAGLLERARLLNAERTRSRGLEEALRDIDKAVHSFVLNKEDDQARLDRICRIVDDALASVPVEGREGEERTAEDYGPSASGAARKGPGAGRSA